MQGQLTTLGREHWHEVYRLMVARRFPSVPDAYDKARPYFETVRMYGLMEGSGLAAGFVFGPPEDGIAYFDVVCPAHMQGLWARPAVLRELFRLAFDEMGLRCVWVQTHHKKALRAALQAGFIPATALTDRHPVLVMTPGTVPARWRTRKTKRKE